MNESRFSDLERQQYDKTDGAREVPFRTVIMYYSRKDWYIV